MEGQTATIDEHIHETKITNKKKESYKTTELGFIPESWKIVKFENILNLFNGYAFKSADAVESSNTQLIRMGNLYQNKLDLERKPIFYPDSYAKKYSKYVLQEGDLIISLTGTSEKEDYGFTVKINKTNKKLLLNQRVARIDIISADVNRDYIFYFLLSRIFLTPLFLTAKGMKQANLSTNAIKKLNVVIPPLEEQRKIAGVLLLVQDAITQQEQLITLTTELKKAFMHKLFTEGTCKEPQRKTEIGFIPENWDVVPLDDLLTLAQYGLSVKGKDSGNYPILRMTNQLEGKIVRKNLQYVEIKQEEFEKFKIEYGDILFNRTNSLELVGRTAIFDIEGDFVFASYLIRLRVNAEKLNPFFLNHYFNWNKIQIRLKGIATRAVSQSNISASRLKGFIIPLPKKLAVQNEIVKSLDYCDSKIAVHRQKCDILNDLFRTLLHQLMTAQIRVDDLNLSALNLELQGGHNNNANL